MRNHLVFWVNGRRHEVRGSDGFLTLAEYLRGPAGLVGTKIMCAEGDCGACSVLVAEPTAAGEPLFRPIDSCIRFLFQIDGCHIVTVEGLAVGDQLAAVQQAMVDCHGSQCGFCTPGFVMAIAGGCEAQSAGAAVEWRRELAGNLCRCTGYVSIFEAAERAARAGEGESLANRYPAAAWNDAGLGLRREPLDLMAEGTDGPLRVTSPVGLEEAVAIRAGGDARVIAGGTDLGVLWNKRKLRPRHWLDLSRIESLRAVRVTHTGGQSVLEAGPLATWTDLIEVCRTWCRPAVAVLESFGGPQIRHVGTLGGNIVNGSPIADSLPLLFVMEATLDCLGPAGSRTVPIDRFYLGYKQLDLAPDALLTGVRLPLPAADEILRLVKVARRRDLDISSFTAAIRLRLAGKRIAAVWLAAGGVGPTVVRLRETEAFLVGRPFTERICREAGEVAAAEIRPLSDVRGSGDFRRQLARNLLVRLYHEQPAESA
jgi:xanthine dehydrogenase small subunit